MKMAATSNQSSNLSKSTGTDCLRGRHTDTQTLCVQGPDQQQIEVQVKTLNAAAAQPTSQLVVYLLPEICLRPEYALAGSRRLQYHRE